jgi:hypothetical protein
LLKTIRQSFASVPDLRGARSEIALSDALMAGLAVFGLKSPSLLKFDEAAREGVIRHNLKTLYGVERAPCDTPLRTLLDPVAPEHLRPAFRAVHRSLQRHKALAAYRYFDGYYGVSVEGTGQFASTEIRCPECGVKTRAGQASDYPQRLRYRSMGAVRVHPALKTVLPLAAEPITRHPEVTKDGASKPVLRYRRERL